MQAGRDSKGEPHNEKPASVLANETALFSKASLKSRCYWTQTVSSSPYDGRERLENVWAISGEVSETEELAELPEEGIEIPLNWRRGINYAKRTAYTCS